MSSSPGFLAEFPCRITAFRYPGRFSWRASSSRTQRRRLRSRTPWEQSQSSLKCSRPRSRRTCVASTSSPSHTGASRSVSRDFLSFNAVARRLLWSAPKAKRLRGGSSNVSLCIYSNPSLLGNKRPHGHVWREHISPRRILCLRLATITRSWYDSGYLRKFETSVSPSSRLPFRNALSNGQVTR